MYKIGDKVETEKGNGTIVAINGYEEQLYIVEITNIGKWGFNEHQLKPYRTAHERLLKLGWKMIAVTTDGTYKTYHKYDKHTKRTMSINIFKDKDDWCFTSDYATYIDKELSKILTQYLEELENSE